MLKGNDCTLWFQRLTVCQKILENKVFQKLKVSKNIFLQKCAPKLLFVIEKKIRKIQMILDLYVLSFKWFFTLQIVLDGSKWQILLVRFKSFWLDLNQVQIRLFWTNFYNLDLSKMIWTQPKQIGPVQNNWYSTKMIWTVQNHFGPIDGQGKIT